jgi:hypothetical protein
MKPAELNRSVICAGVIALALGVSGVALAGPPKTKMDTPTISSPGASATSIFITFTAGSPSGAPSGFSLQWMSLEGYNANLPTGWLFSDDPVLCKASFSGNASGYNYKLGAGGTMTVEVGDLLLDNGASTNCATPLEQCTDYVFHSFSHADNKLQRSDWSNPAPYLLARTGGDCGGTNTTCRTGYLGLPNNDPAVAPFYGNCTTTQGYYKQQHQYEIVGVTLGNVSYTAAEIIAIYDMQVGGGCDKNAGCTGALVKLGHALSTAKLNVYHGADGAVVATTIASADALIGSKIVGLGTLTMAQVSTLVAALNSFNEGLTGPGHCAVDYCEGSGGAPPPPPTE